jgi:hypothetical protein
MNERERCCEHVNERECVKASHEIKIDFVFYFLTLTHTHTHIERHKIIKNYTSQTREREREGKVEDGNELLEGGEVKLMKEAVEGEVFKKRLFLSAQMCQYLKFNTWRREKEARHLPQNERMKKKKNL